MLCMVGPAAAQSPPAPAAATAAQERVPQRVEPLVPAPPVETLPRPAPAVETPREGLLVLDTDAACELRVGGVAQKKVLLPGAPRTVAVPPGQSTLECTSTTVPEVKVRLVKAVEAGARQTIAFEVADLVFKAMCAGKPATLADLGHGVLRHCVTRVDWTQADSQTDTDNAAARAWCTKKGEGWGLPAADELAELIDRSGRSSTTCGRFTCNVSTRFRLTAPTYWSKDANGPELALVVHLLLGGRHSALLDVQRGYRALCVKRP